MFTFLWLRKLFTNLRIPMNTKCEFDEIRNLGLIHIENSDNPEIFEPSVQKDWSTPLKSPARARE